MIFFICFLSSSFNICIGQQPKLMLPVGHTSYVYSASFSPDGNYIVTASNDNTAKVWNTVSGELLADLKGHTSEVTSASFSPDGKYIVTVSYDYTAKVWNTVSGQLLIDLKGHTNGVSSASFSPDGKYIVTYGDYEAKVWNSKSGQLVSDFAAVGPRPSFLSKATTSTRRIWCYHQMLNHKALTNYMSKAWDFSHIYINKFLIN